MEESNKTQNGILCEIMARDKCFKCDFYSSLEMCLRDFAFRGHSRINCRPFEITVQYADLISNRESTVLIEIIIIIM